MDRMDLENDNWKRPTGLEELKQMEKQSQNGTVKHWDGMVIGSCFDKRICTAEFVAECLLLFSDLLQTCASFSAKLRGAFTPM